MGVYSSKESSSNEIQSKRYESYYTQSLKPMDYKTTNEVVNNIQLHDDFQLILDHFNSGYNMLLPHVTLMECFHRAISLINVEAVQACVLSGIDTTAFSTNTVHCKDDPDEVLLTPLMRACFANSLEITKILLESGLNSRDINVADSRGMTALMYCVLYSPNLHIIRMLIDHGADVNVSCLNQPHISLLGYCCLDKQRLFSNSPESNVVNPNTNFPNNLMVLIIELLLESGANIAGNGSVYNRLGEITSKLDPSDIPMDSNPLFLNCQHASNSQVLEHLCAYGANVYVNSTNSSNLNPICALVRNEPGNYHLFKKQLVERQSRSQVTMSSELNEVYSPSQFHKYTKSVIDCISTLIKFGADVNQPDINGQTALMQTVSNSNPQIVKHLINSKANINAQDNQGLTTLMIYCRDVSDSNDVASENILLLIKHNANVDLLSKTGKNALFYSCFLKNNYNVSLLLLRQKANLNIVSTISGMNKENSQGLSPLIHLIRNGPELPRIKLFLERGADLNLPCLLTNDTPIAHALFRLENVDLALFLIENSRINLLDYRSDDTYIQGDDGLGLSVVNRNRQTPMMVLVTSAKYEDGIVLSRILDVFVKKLSQ